MSNQEPKPKTRWQPSRGTLTGRLLTHPFLHCLDALHFSVVAALHATVPETCKTRTHGLLLSFAVTGSTDDIISALTLVKVELLLLDEISRRAPFFSDDVADLKSHPASAGYVKLGLFAWVVQGLPRAEIPPNAVFQEGILGLGIAAEMLESKPTSEALALANSDWKEEIETRFTVLKDVVDSSERAPELIILFRS